VPNTDVRVQRLLDQLEDPEISDEEIKRIKKKLDVVKAQAK
jgi:hypothetical protein